MKRFLISTTALVAFAGTAAADVALSGRAEMGISGGTAVETQFFTDIDVTFTMSGETDNGLTFGASVDLDEGGSGAPAVAANDDDGGATIFISGAFGTVTMGDTDGAMDWALTEAGNVGNPGSIADDETSHAGYLGAYGDGAYDGQILRYDYSAGDFGVAVSVEMDDSGVQSDGYAIGLKYKFDLSGTTVNLGLGYQSAQLSNSGFGFGNDLANAGFYFAGDEIKIVGVSANATLANGVSVGMTYSMLDAEVGGAPLWETDHIGVGVGYSTGALSLHANYGVFESTYPGVAGSLDSSGYGLAVAYDLGGGAVVHGGYGKSKLSGGLFGTPNVSTNTFSLGLGLSF